MDVEDFITKVKLNPAIWDQRIKQHSNRNIVDNCWRQISLEMDIDETVLRKKWKYLRDQFSVEYSKVKPPKSDAAKTTDPKWPHFKRLLFLKDIVKPRVSARKHEITNATEDEEDERAVDDFSQWDDKETDCIDLNVAERENANWNMTETQPAELNQTASFLATQRRKRRRMMATNTLNRSNEKILLQLEQKRMDSMQSSFQRELDNDDMMFFRSLLPFVSTIATQNKLRFRSRIHEVVEEFAFAGEPLQPSSGMSD